MEQLLNKKIKVSIAILTLFLVKEFKYHYSNIYGAKRHFKTVLFDLSRF